MTSILEEETPGNGANDCRKKHLQGVLKKLIGRLGDINNSFQERNPKKESGPTHTSPFGLVKTDDGERKRVSLAI